MLRKFIMAGCIGMGLVIAGSDGIYFPLVNVGGLILLLIGMKIGEKTCLSKH